MLRIVVTALVFLGGLFFIMSGLSFLLQPQTTAPGLGLIPNGAIGLATTRADFFAFFGFLGICMIWGAWKRRGDLLRLLSLSLDGPNPAFASSIAIEGVLAALLLFARAILPHHRLEDVGE